MSLHFLIVEMEVFSVKKNEQPDSDFPKLSAPAQRALAGAGYSRLEQLTKVKVADIKKLHGLGPTTIVALRKALSEKGLSFADESS